MAAVMPRGSKGEKRLPVRSILIGAGGLFIWIYDDWHGKPHNVVTWIMVIAGIAGIVIVAAAATFLRPRNSN
jgi:hypothetical protein